MTFVTKKFVSRRSFLRGATGAVIALPFLDAMVPALTAQQKTAAKPPLRFGALYWPNGALPDQFFPSVTGRDFEFSAVTKPLEPFRERLLTVSGLVAPRAPIHTGSSSSWLNGIGPKGRSGEQVESEKTLDQFIVDAIGQDTPLPSLEVGTEDMGTAGGSCNEWACIYVNTLAWRSATTPLPVEINPRITFERMFGETGTTEQRLARLNYKRSLLDSMVQQANQLRAKLGASDRVLLSHYLDNIREVERQIQQIVKRSSEDVSAPDAPSGVPESVEEHLKITYDLLHLAWQGDITRVFTFLLGVETSNRSYAHIGVSESHHAVSHHGNDPEQMAKYMTIVSYEARMFADFVRKLDKTPDGDGSLLDHSLLLFGSGMGNGNQHARESPPTIILGGEAYMRGRGNNHVRAEVPSPNLLLNIAEMAGVNVENFTNATGKVAL